jgi:hypothetical protein
MLETIKQWAFTLVITAVVGGLANSFTVSDNGNMKKYIKFACSIVALAVMIMPMKEMFREMPKMFDANPVGYEESEIEYKENMDYLNELTVAKTNELLKKRIYDIVYEKTGIKPDSIYIYIKQNDNAEIYVEKIIIEMLENEEIKLYLKQLFNCEVSNE